MSCKSPGGSTRPRDDPPARSRDRTDHFCLDRVGQIGEELIREGVPLVCLDRKPGAISASADDGKVITITERQIDVLHAHQYTPFFYSAFAKVVAKRRPKLILTEHGRHYPDIVNPKRRAFNRLILDRLARRRCECLHSVQCDGARDKRRLPWQSHSCD